jgi:type 1 fimbriae regulatory protein FimB
MKNPQYLTKDELLKVLEVARNHGPREHAMFLIAYVHALRVSEIASLTLNDIRGGKIDVQRLKGSLHTVQPMHKDANPLLDEPSVLKAWLRERGDGDGSQFVFTSRQGSALNRRQIYNLFEAVCIRSGIEAGRRNIHILKHSILAHLLRAGASVAYLQIAAGHKDPKSTLCYTHVSDNEAAEVVSAKMAEVFA